MNNKEIIEHLGEYLQSKIDNGEHKIFYNDLAHDEKVIDVINALEDLKEERDKYKIVLDKIKEKGVMYYDPEYSKIYGELCSMPGANNIRTPVIVIDDEILELLEEIE